MGKFRDHFLERELDSISSEEVLSFLTSLNDSCKQLTKHTRYAYLKALFNFIRNNLDPQLQNPCDTPMLKKLFRTEKLTPWQIHEKEVIDEIIFRTTKVRNRIMLELMARGGMRVGEVLKPMPQDQGCPWRSSARSSLGTPTSPPLRGTSARSAVWKR